METGENVEEEDIEPITDEDPSGSGAEDDEKINDNMDGTSREHDEGESSSNRPAAAIHDWVRTPTGLAHLWSTSKFQRGCARRLATSSTSLS